MSIKSRMTRNSIKKLEKLIGGKLTLGKLLLSIRQSEDTTQVKFAERLNISRQQLCDIEHDRKTISPRLAADYAKKLNYSSEQFVRLCLQDMLDRSGVELDVDVSPHHQGNHNYSYA